MSIENQNGIVNEQPSTTTQDVGSPAQENSNVQQTQQDTTSTKPTEYEIDGFGKVKLDELKEWKNGYMRQSDYTKKTQELAKQRAEQKEALEVYTYLKNNPQIANAIASGDTSAIQNNPAFSGLNPYNQQIQDVNMKLATLELDRTLSDLRNKYGDDFNEVEVLTEADRLGVSDLEFVHNALQGRKMPTLKDQLKKEIQNELTEQIRRNGLQTKTIINDNDTPTNVGNFGLSDAEVAIAKRMNLTPEQYAKGKSLKI